MTKNYTPWAIGVLSSIALLLLGLMIDSIRDLGEDLKNHETVPEHIGARVANDFQDKQISDILIRIQRLEESVFDGGK